MVKLKALLNPITKMINYNSKKYHRRTIRLNNYDYASKGAYFITICTCQKENIFGDVVGGKIVLNDIGMIVDRYWNKIQNYFLNVETDEYIIMPNHVHGIIFILNELKNTTRAQQPLPTRGCHAPTDDARNGTHGRKFGDMEPGSISSIICTLKSLTTRTVNKQMRIKGGTIWQRNYFERIIRNKNELNKIRLYIVNNPVNWEMDKENPFENRNNS